MNTHVQIRNVDKALHRKLKMRAAEKDMSISDFLKKLIAQELDRPNLAELAERLKRRPAVRTTLSSAELVRQDRDDDSR